MSGRNSQKTPRDGFQFQVTTCLAMCVLLVLNVAFVASFYRTLAPEGHAFLSHRKAEQVILLMGPVVVLVIQWWLIDVVRNQLRVVKKRKRQHSR